MVDDASYSGIQMDETIRSLNEVSTTKFFMAVAYMSTTARLLLTTHYKNKIIIPPSTESFSSIYQLASIEEKKILDDEINLEQKYPIKRISIRHTHLLYLDFKLPDSVSVPHIIFAYGFKVGDPSYTRIEEVDKLRSLISGCTDTYRNNLHISKSTFDLNKTDLIGGVCPTSFYKSVEWKEYDEEKEYDEKEEVKDFIEYMKIHRNGVGRIKSFNSRGYVIPSLQHFDVCQKLTELIINDVCVRTLTDMPYLSHLLVLDLDNCELTDLTGISQLTSLTNLVLTNNNIVSLKPLSTLTKLISLNITNNKVKDLFGIPNNLQHLFINNNRINNLDPLIELTSLSQLYASDNNIVSLDPLKDLDLTLLNINNNQVVDISTLPISLLFLYCSNNKVVDISSLSRLSDILGLDISDNKIESLNTISSLITLIELHLDNIPFDIDILSELSSLKTLSVKNCGLTEIRINPECEMQRLFLSNNPIDSIPEEINYLFELTIDGTNITSLSFFDNGHDDLESITVSRGFEENDKNEIILFSLLKNDVEVHFVEN